MRGLSQAGRMSTEPATYPGYRFPAEVIHHAVWLYHVFSLSLRDIELILAERGRGGQLREHQALVPPLRHGVRGKATQAAAEAGRHLAHG